MDKVFIPPIKIQGIKTKIVPLIKRSVLLSHNTIWIEPFMGSGVVGFNVAPSVAVFSDINPHIIQFYNQIKERKITASIVRNFLEEQGEILSIKDGEYYYEVRERFNQQHDSLDFLFLNRSCFNGMMRFNKDYAFNVPYGHKRFRFSKAYITKIVNQIAHVEKLLSENDWSFICQSFEQTIKDANESSFIYCDPPYIGRHVDYYDSWNEQSEIMLHDMLVSSGAMFMLSTWDRNVYRVNPYIGTLWGNYHKIIQEHYYYVGAKESNRNAMQEALLMNYIPIQTQNQVSEQVRQLALFS